jgi:hypothetical protein
MSAGKGKIEQGDRINGFDKRPQDAGYPKGKPNRQTILKEVLKAKLGKERTEHELDPLYFFASEMIDIITDKKVKHNDKAAALDRLVNRFYGMPEQEIESTVTNTNPTFIVKDEKHKKEIEKRKDF